MATEDLKPPIEEALVGGPDWGFMVGNKFVQVPKLPCVRAGHVAPPFDVKLPGGQIRRIIERPQNG